MSSAAMSSVAVVSDCESARRIAAVCRRPEAGAVQAQVAAAVPHPTQAAVLWLTWVQLRALGRDLMVRETDLSLWTLTDRLRQLREAGAPVLSSSEERDLIARGRFHGEWA